MGTYQEMIADVRESRVRMSAKCGHDVERLLDYLHSFEIKHAKEVKLFETLQRPHPRHPGLSQDGNSHPQEPRLPARTDTAGRVREWTSPSAR